MTTAPDPPPGPPLDATRIAEALQRNGVEYVMIGGLAASSWGAQRPTHDADLIAARDPANLDRLAAALRDLGARLRVEGLTDEQAKQLPVRLDAHTLSAMEISTWTTDAGGVDVLADLPTIDQGRLTYEQLAQRSSQHAHTCLRVAVLEDVIASKQWADRPKDREALAELHQLRDSLHAKRLADLGTAGPGKGPGRPAPGEDPGRSAVGPTGRPSTHRPRRGSHRE
jgi:hypothetical protein